MVKVKNKAIINILAKNSFKYNKIRNIVSIIAVILTTILFTTVFTLSLSLTKTFQEEMIRQVGTSFHGGFKYLNLERYEKLSKHKDIKEISYSIVLALGENKEFRKNQVELRSSKDEIVAKNSFSFPTTGTMPQNEYELATDTKVLKLLGVPQELGQQVTLEYSLNGTKIKEIFKLVGFWESDNLSPANTVWLSSNYVDRKLKEFNLPDENKEKDAIGKISAEFNLNNSFNIEKKILKIIDESGYTPSEIDYGVNWAYVGSKGLTSSVTLAVIGITLLIIFSGYLIISNIFYISIFRDVKIYGLLKTIGTTNKQIKYLIKKQANYICIISIPIGLILGYFIGKFSVPILMSLTTASSITISINPFIFIFSAIFTLITINISILKPCKFISKVTAIEAIKYNENTKQNRKKARKTKKANIFNMAYENVLRNRKKFILVTISLSLSGIILNTAFSMSNSLDLEKYLNEYIYGDFMIGDLSIFKAGKFFNPQENALDDKVANEISSINGIDNINKIYFNSIYVDKDDKILSLPEKLEPNSDSAKNITEFLPKREQIPVHIYGIEDSIFKDFEVVEGNIDLEKLKTGKYVIVSPYEFGEEKTTIYDVGDTIYFENENGEEKQFEVLAIAEHPYGIDVRYSTGIGLIYYFPINIFLDNFKSITPMFLSLNVNENNKDNVDKYLKDYTKNINEDLEYISKDIYTKQFEDDKKSYQIIGILISSILGLIGILNFINTIVTSIIARKGELAILQSIGMTEKQLKKLLIFEGSFYVITSFIITITIGSLIAIEVVKSFTFGSNVMSPNYTAFPSLFLVLLILLILFVTINICERKIKNNSVVERLRDFDN